MGRKTELTAKTVYPEIHHLVAEGLNPTSERLRERLGGRGSPIVLQRFITDWFKDHGARLAGKIKAAPPTMAPTGLKAELQQLTAAAVQEFEAAQAERVAKLEAQDAALKGREEGLLVRERDQDAKELAHAELLVDLRQQLALANSQLEAGHARALEEAGRAHGQIEALQAALADRETELARLRPLAEQLPALHASLERAQADATREQARVVEVVGERERLQRLAEDRAAELAKLKAVLERADAAAATQSATVATLRQELQESQASYAASVARAQAQDGALEQALAERAADAALIASLRQTAEETAQRLAAVDAHRDAVVVMDGRLKPMEATLERLEADLRKLRSNKAKGGRKE